jgi:predicted O-methyltransferase YrrM
MQKALGRVQRLISLIGCYRAVKAYGDDRGLDRALDFVFFSDRGLLRPLQRRSEIHGLLVELTGREPAVVVEIGTASGGNLFLFTRVAAADAVIASIDLPAGNFGGGYGLWRVPLYRSFAMARQRVHLIRSDSHARSTFERLKRVLEGRPIDFLFIDGDHSYEGVKRDFELYHPLVSPSGLIALHDIVAHPPGSGCEVDRFWREVRQVGNWREIVADRDSQFAGIGVIASDPRPSAPFEARPSRGGCRPSMNSAPSV